MTFLQRLHLIQELKSVNSVQNAKTPSDTRIKIREQRTKGSPDIVYFNDTVDSFFNCREVSLKIAEKLSVLSVNKIYVKHKKLVIEVSNPKIQT